MGTTIFWRCGIALLLLLGKFSTVYAEDLSGLDRGHRLLIGNGLQLMALVDRDITNVSSWQNSHFTTLQFSDHQTSTGGGPAGRINDLNQFPSAQWGRLTWSAESHPNVVTAAEVPFLPRLTMLQYLDERSIFNATQIAEDKAILAAWRARYPNAIGFTNQFGSAVNTSGLQSYMNQVEPDMLYFDRYVFRGGTSTSDPSIERGTLYFHMQRYREVASMGHDLTGSSPIPYGMYTQNTVIPGNLHDASGSETNLQYFGAFAFGFKSISAFTYSRPKGIDGLQHSMFNAANTIVSTANGQPFDTNPKPMYFDVSEANRQALNLGPTLTRLLSTDVRVDRGLQSNGSPNRKASNVDDWNSAADPFITSIAAVNNGTLNNGNRGDVTMGYFTPLLDGFAGGNDTYFMVVNGLTDRIGTPAQTEQTVTLSFDFGASGIDSLLRVSRNTGEIEILDDPTDGWMHLGGSQYQLELTLDGGVGDLLKFNTGHQFVGIEFADFDTDGDVDGADFLAWQRGFGTTSGASLADGDTNWDGKVNADDLTIWQAQFDSHASSTLAAAVPEPSTAGLLILAMVGTSLANRAVFKRCSRCI